MGREWPVKQRRAAAHCAASCALFEGSARQNAGGGITHTKIVVWHPHVAVRAPEIVLRENLAHDDPLRAFVPKHAVVAFDSCGLCCPTSGCRNGILAHTQLLRETVSNAFVSPEIIHA